MASAKARRDRLWDQARAEGGEPFKVGSMTVDPAAVCWPTHPATTIEDVYRSALAELEGAP